jgi:N-acetylneuraminate synthase
LYEDLNLLVIKEMIRRYPKALIGHSDHTGELYSSLAAITLGAKILEKHVILDKKMKGPDQKVSIDFYELKKLVDGAKKINLSLGKEKKVHQKEKQIRKWAFRSLVSIKKIPKNKIIDQEDIWCKRPGTGIPSYLMNDVIGLRTLKEIDNNQLIDWKDLEKK